MLYHLFKHVLIGPALRRRVSITVTGAEHVPTSGPLIVASNHLAEVDSLVLPLAVPRRLSFFAKAEYFRAPGIAGAASRAFFAGTGQIPVDRGGDAAALDAAEALLRSDGAWGIYPEGTRSPDGRLHRGHTGAMRVAARVPDVTVLPIAIAGTREVNPPGRRRLNRGTVTVRIGEPLDLASLAADGDIRAATDRLMVAISDLGDLDYVDSYARHHTSRP